MYFIQINNIQRLTFTTSLSLSVAIVPTYASRPLLRCRPRAQYEVHELPLFVEKSRSCRVVQERALVQHEQVASKKKPSRAHPSSIRYSYEAFIL